MMIITACAREAGGSPRAPPAGRPRSRRTATPLQRQRNADATDVRRPRYGGVAMACRIRNAACIQRYELLTDGVFFVDCRDTDGIRSVPGKKHRRTEMKMDETEAHATHDILLDVESRLKDLAAQTDDPDDDVPVNAGELRAIAEILAAVRCQL